MIFTDFSKYIKINYELIQSNYAVKKDIKAIVITRPVTTLWPPSDHPVTTLSFLPLHVHTRPWLPPASRLRSTGRRGSSQRSDPPSPTWRCSSSGRTRHRRRRYRQSTWADDSLLNRWKKQLASLLSWSIIFKVIFLFFNSLTALRTLPLYVCPNRKINHALNYPHKKLLYTTIPVHSQVPGHDALGRGVGRRGALGQQGLLPGAVRQPVLRNAAWVEMAYIHCFPILFAWEKHIFLNIYLYQI